MGVSHLWSVLAPVKQKVTFSDLKGQILAVDLGLWICELQFIQHNPMSFQTPYLRTLYFRILKFLQFGIKLVFVVDGEATDIKLKTITKRFKKGDGDVVSEVMMNKFKSRKTFRSIQKQCTQLLDTMGIPHCESEGEGEKLCAILNQKGLVDGVLTSDGDVFLYGAKKVYRNLSLDKSGNTEPSLEYYSADVIKSKLQLSREHLITFGILVGCDYIPKGITGIGKEGALKFLSNSSRPLHLFNEVYRLNNSSDHCQFCKHQGIDHNKNGCQYCHTEFSCSIHTQILCSCSQHQKITLGNRHIVSTVEKCSYSEGFPFKPIVKEFLETSHSTDVLSRALKWTCPSVKQFKAFTSLVFLWDDRYCLQQTLSVLAAWRLHFGTCSCEHNDEHDCLTKDFYPIKILKLRRRNYQNCVEVLWSHPKLIEIIFESLNMVENSSELMTTVENFELVSNSFPEIVTDFEKRPTKGNKDGSKKTKRKHSAPVAKTLSEEKENDVKPLRNNDAIDSSLYNLSLHSPSKKSCDDVKSDAVFVKTPCHRIGAEVCLKRDFSNLKRPYCFSPQGGDSKLPVASTPRIGTTPYRSLSPESFFKKMNPQVNTDHGTCSPIPQSPSPYLDVEEIKDMNLCDVINKALKKVNKQLVTDREDVFNISDCEEIVLLSD